jgi:hypothetical protein
VVESGELLEDEREKLLGVSPSAAGGGDEVVELLELGLD